jgi:hypothetical protein
MFGCYYRIFPSPIDSIVDLNGVIAAAYQMLVLRTQN